jgi:hypothetical protein
MKNKTAIEKIFNLLILLFCCVITYFVGKYFVVLEKNIYILGAPKLAEQLSSVLLSSH